MVVAIGFFDGVHLGHRHVISALVEAAGRRGTTSVALTFWPHPRTVLQLDARSLKLLSSLTEKEKMLKGLGVDEVRVVPFTKKFATLTMEEFLREYVVGELHADSLLLGYDNRLGCDMKEGDEIAAAAQKLGIEVIRTEAVEAPAGIPVSSTKIRAAVGAGAIDLAASMLGYFYGIHGVVVAGGRLGRKLGYPTANVQPCDPLKLIPANGVYAVKVRVLGREFVGMCNIGVKPTVTDARQRSIEVHIFDFDEDVYGLDIDVMFVRKTRDERRFDSLDSLREQLASDVIVCKEILSDFV